MVRLDLASIAPYGAATDDALGVADDRARYLLDGMDRQEHDLERDAEEVTRSG